MSVRMTSTWRPRSNARCSATVSAARGVSSRSTAGSSATVEEEHGALERGAPRRSVPRKKPASRWVTPIAAKTTTNSSAASLAGHASPARRSARRARRPGRPKPEKIGSFWPRTSVLRPSIAEIPVSMNSVGMVAGDGVDRQPVDVAVGLGLQRRPAVDRAGRSRRGCGRSGRARRPCARPRRGRGRSCRGGSGRRVPASTWTTIRSPVDREHLAAPDRSVRRDDVDELVVADPLGLLGEEQRPRDVGHRPVLDGEAGSLRSCS